MVGEAGRSATIARLRGELHLDEPIPAQFGHYLWASSAATWVVPTSRSAPVLGDLAERFPKTLQSPPPHAARGHLRPIALGVPPRSARAG